MGHGPSTSTDVGSGEVCTVAVRVPTERPPGSTMTMSSSTSRLARSSCSSTPSARAFWGRADGPATVEWPFPTPTEPRRVRRTGGITSADPPLAVRGARLASPRGTCAVALTTWWSPRQIVCLRGGWGNCRSGITPCSTGDRQMHHRAHRRHARSKSVPEYLMPPRIKGDVHFAPMLRTAGEVADELRNDGASRAVQVDTRRPSAA